MPPVVAGVAAAVTAFGVAHPVLMFAGRIAAGFVLSAATNHLMGKPKAPTALKADTSRQLSVRQALAPCRTIYGETLVGGNIVYVETSGAGNAYIHIFTARAAHEISGFEELWLGPERLVVSGNDVTSPLHTRYTDRAWVYTHLGTDDQVADAQMLADTAGGWTSAHRLRGIAYDHLKLKNAVQDETNVWADFNLEEIAWRVRGKPVYDPRDGITRFTRNPALILRDYLTTSHKLRIATARINDTTVSDAANVCDEQVALAATTQTFTALASTDVLTLTDALGNLRRGNVVRVSTDGGLPSGLSAGTDYYVIPVSKLGIKLATSLNNALAGTAIDVTTAGTGTHTLTLRSELRYAMDGIIEDSDHQGDVVRAMLAAMAGVITYSGGKYEIHAGAATTSTLSLDDDDLHGGLRIAARRSRQAIFNRVKPTYLDPDQDYQPVPAPAVTNATYLAQDNGEPIWHTADYPFCDSPARAQRLAKIELERCRQQITGVIPLNMKGLQAKAWGVVDYTNTQLGWSAKALRVTKWSIGQDGSIQLVVSEESPAMWDWNTEENAPDAAPDTNLPNYRTVTAPPTPITVTEELRATATGTAVTVLSATVTASPDTFVRDYRWQFRKSSDSANIALPNTGTNVEITVAEDGTPYTIRVAAVNGLGFISDFIETTYTPVGQSAAPDNVTGFSSNIIGHQVHLSWDAITEIDFKACRVRYTADLVTPSWASAVDCCPLVAKPATSIVLPARTGTWLIKAVDQTGHESETAATTAAAIATLGALNFVATATENPSFAGTHSNTVAAAGILSLATTGDAIGSWPTLGAIAAIGLGIGEVVSEGTYTFANKIDLGAVYKSRVTADVEVDAEDFNNAIGGWPTLGDVLHLGGNETGNYDVVLQVRTTPDDPASGGAVWSDWRTFSVGDYACRGYHFRAILKSFFPTVTPLVAALSVTVDMPDRTLSARDVATLAAGTAITFATPFKVPPAVAVTASGLASGDWHDDITVSAGTLSATGFTYRGRNAAGAGKAHTISWTAQGY